MKKKRLSKKEARKAALMVAHGAPVSEAMMAVGFADSTSHDHPERLKMNPVFQDALHHLEKTLLLKEQKLFDMVADVLLEGLDAKKELPDGSGAYPDFSERRKYADLLARILGQMGNKVTGKPSADMNFSVLIAHINAIEKERGLR